MEYLCLYVFTYVEWNQLFVGEERE
jgi:hypothetical protein